VEPTDIRPRLREVAEDGTASLPSRAQAAAAPAQGGTQVLPPSAFRAGEPGTAEALQDALAYGFYARAAEDGREPARVAGEPATADMIARYRAQATADLHAYAFRYLHNHAEQIRQDAIREHLTHLRRPPGFITLVVASLVGVLLGALVIQDLLPVVERHGGIVGLAQALMAGLRGLGG
jgi:hypothetical protein